MWRWFANVVHQIINHLIRNFTMLRPHTGPASEGDQRKMVEFLCHVGLYQRVAYWFSLGWTSQHQNTTQVSNKYILHGNIIEYLHVEIYSGFLDYSQACQRLTCIDLLPLQQLVDPYRFDPSVITAQWIIHYHSQTDHIPMNYIPSSLMCCG